MINVLQNDEFEKYPFPTQLGLDLLIESYDKAIRKLIMIQILSIMEDDGKDLLVLFL